MAVRARQVYFDFSNKYLDKHGMDLKREYGNNSQKFVEQFEITDELLEQINAMAKNKGIEVKKDAYERDKRSVKLLAKMTIAKALFGNVGSSRVFLSEDVQFKKAVGLFPEAEKISKNLTSVR